MTDTLNAREEMLRSIRSANARPSIPAVTAQEYDRIPRQYHQTGTLDFEQRVDLLIDRLRDYGAGVYRCQRAQVASFIAEILRQRGKQKILVPPDIDPAWLLPGPVEFLRDEALSSDVIDACDGALTGCTVAIAATGTLALCHGDAGQGRRILTLLPDYHGCVVDLRDVVETVPEGMRILASRRSQPITLISGPSATADIEMTRIQGVHGPRVLDVLLVE
jgi:L-lactate dehydrogenase complex protein LldG